MTRLKTRVFDFRRKPRLVRSYDQGAFDGMQANETAPGRLDRALYAMGYRHGSAMRRAVFARLRRQS